MPLEHRAGHLLKRSGTKCGPKLGNSPTSRVQSANFATIEIQRNGSQLDSRMKLPKVSMGYFYHSELAVTSEEIVPEIETHYADEMSTAVIKSFADVIAPKQWSGGMQGLSGCTSLYIISRTGVYGTHWWESISFAPDDIWRDPPTQTDAQLFQDTVIDLLVNGGVNHPRLDATKLDDKYIKAYLIHPSQTWEQKGAADKGYVDQWNDIRTTVGKIIPRLTDESRWGDISYVALRNDDPRLGTRMEAYGKNLFKYDPAHVKSDKTTTRKATLWVEGSVTPVHDDQW